VKISWIPIKEEIMITERTWPVRAMYILIAVALAMGLFLTVAPAQKVSANPGLSKWDRVPTPTVQGWVLAPNSTIIDFAVAAGGEVAYTLLYSTYNYSACGCVACNPEPEGPWYVLKSTDSCATWSSITKGIKTEITKKNLGNITELVAIACDAAAPDFLAVALDVSAGGLHVFISNDGGTTFHDTGAVALDEVGDLEVSPATDTMHDIAIGGEAGDVGKIFRNQAIGGLGTGWVDTSDTTQYPGWQSCGWVADIQFSPSWSTDHGILAVTESQGSSPYGIYLQTGIWGDTPAWNNDAINIDAVLVTTVDSFDGAGIALPSNYKATDKNYRYAWVWVNSEDGGWIYKVIDKTPKAIGMQIDGNPELTNVSYLGTIASGTAIAGLLYPEEGCCSGVQVYRKGDITNMDTCPTCASWLAACKPPTGVYGMAAFYVSPTKAYAVALYNEGNNDEGAWSVSWEGTNAEGGTIELGDVWNQLSLIDTEIDYLSDVAVSPNCNKIMLVSVNTGEQDRQESCYCDSVWLKATNLPEAVEYSGQWLRTWCGQLGDEQWGLLRLPPDAITGNLTTDEIAGDTVYLVDYGTNTVYWNDLETLDCWNPCTATTLTDIVDLAASSNDTVYALDRNGKVAMSDEYACNWHAAVDSLVCGYTIAVHGDSILVGSFNGEVSYSDDGGKTFTRLEDVHAGTDVYVTVAFDSYFDTNNVVYAALAGAGSDNGIYSWVIGTSTEWKNIGAEPYDYTGIVLSNADGNPMTSADTGGVLYASYVDQSDYPYSGVARCLNPAGDISCEKCVEWDYLTVGLTGNVGFDATPDALKICGCLTPDSSGELYAIDDWNNYDMCKGQDGTVWTFEDCYAKKAPELLTPANGATIQADCNCNNLPFSLKWDAVCDACYYDVQIALDPAFTELEIDTTVTGLSYIVPSDLTCQITYYWRVRAYEANTGQEIHSWWSDWSGTETSITVAPSTAQGVLNLIAPVSGANDVAVKNVGFSWSLQATADTFVWKLSTDPTFSSTVNSQTLSTTAYNQGTLSYNTTYYWQVTAYEGSTLVSTSAVGTFRTMEQATTPTPTTQPTPNWVWVVIAIGAVLVIVVIVLIFRTRRV
jgi:hypothetical protein